MGLFTSEPMKYVKKKAPSQVFLVTEEKIETGSVATQCN